MFWLHRLGGAREPLGGHNKQGILEITVFQETHNLSKRLVGRVI